GPGSVTPTLASATSPVFVTSYVQSTSLPTRIAGPGASAASTPFVFLSSAIAGFSPPPVVVVVPVVLVSVVLVVPVPVLVLVLVLVLPEPALFVHEAGIVSFTVAPVPLPFGKPAVEPPL